MNTTLAGRIQNVLSAIADSSIAAGRKTDEVRLIAVSKTHPVEILRQAIASGAAALGENKVQEAESKISEIGRDAAEWHLIGHLQSNKARRAVKLFDVIHSVDSLELAMRLERLCEEEDVASLDVLVQVDLAMEATKNGCPEGELAAITAFLVDCKRLKFKGLMTIPPYFDDAEMTRPYFRRLRELRDDLCPGGELSMGMSHDFAVAIAEGATLVRVGTAIFGEREYRT